MELMIKREAEKETQDDLKQVFRVFDKVIMVSINANSNLSLKLDLKKMSPFFNRMGMDLCQPQKSSLSCPSKLQNK